MARLFLKQLSSISTYVISGLFLLPSCNLMRAKPTNEQASPTFDPIQIDEDISTYAAHCRAELGFDSVAIPPLNCLEGTEIPLTIDGVTPNDAIYSQLKAGKIGCDNPSWLEGVGCVNYNFVLNHKVTREVDLALICRKRAYTSSKNRAEREQAFLNSPTADNFKQLYFFDSLGMIVTNNKTGKSCFFDQVDPVYGGYIAYPDNREPPTEAQLPSPKPPREITTDPKWSDLFTNLTPDKIWKKPFVTARFDRCTTCHDSGLWIHSPWLPPGTNVPANPKNVPLIPIGPAFEYWRTTFEPTGITTADVTIGTKTEAQLCTGCHTIGREVTCKSIISVATGHSTMGMVSDLSKKPKNARWMPPITAEEKLLTDDAFELNWQQKYKPHYDALKRCCDNPLQEGCVKTSFGH